MTYQSIMKSLRCQSLTSQRLRVSLYPTRGKIGLQKLKLNPICRKLLFVIGRRKRTMKLSFHQLNKLLNSMFQDHFCTNSHHQSFKEHQRLQDHFSQNKKNYLQWFRAGKFANSLTCSLSGFMSMHWRGIKALRKDFYIYSKRVFRSISISNATEINTKSLPWSSSNNNYRWVIEVANLGQSYWR